MSQRTHAFFWRLNEKRDVRILLSASYLSLNSDGRNAIMNDEVLGVINGDNLVLGFHTDKRVDIWLLSKLYEIVRKWAIFFLLFVSLCLHHDTICLSHKLFNAYFLLFKLPILILYLAHFPQTSNVGVVHVW